MGQINSGVMVTDFDPMLPPLCCHLDMIIKINSVFHFLNNSKRLQAVIRYVKIYYSLTLLGCLRPHKVKNHFGMRVISYVDGVKFEKFVAVSLNKKLTQMLCCQYL